MGLIDICDIAYL